MLLTTLAPWLALALCCRSALGDVRARVLSCSVYKNTLNGQDSLQYNVILAEVFPGSRPSICDSYFASMKRRGVLLGCASETDTGLLMLGYHLETAEFTNDPQWGFTSTMQTFQDTIGDPSGNNTCHVQDDSSDVDYPSLTRRDEDASGDYELGSTAFLGERYAELMEPSTFSDLARRQPQPAVGFPFHSGFRFSLVSGLSLFTKSITRDVLNSNALVNLPTTATDLTATVNEMAAALGHLGRTHGVKEVLIRALGTGFMVSFDTAVSGGQLSITEQDWRLIVQCMLDAFLTENNRGFENRLDIMLKRDGDVAGLTVAQFTAILFPA
ncbi:uncharacterized protein LTR77_000664 [Saxophila tyrrhenica]|uniref:EF-hand domain-containing protein n=1 Tax=Saxophila tyrrhenica TaxID=1690608 RepID=A0AAV9PS05_9PEZI|nr:hypothetical protein LTR77_000664 [Saxophila tyrrhenica]